MIMLKFFKNRIVKSVVLTALPIAIGVLLPKLIEEGIDTSEGIILLFINIILCILEIIALVFYAKIDKTTENYEDINAKYKALLSSYKNINDVVLNDADDIYKMLKKHNITSSNKNYEYLKSNCDTICYGIYELLNTLSMNDSKYTVSVVLSAKQNEEEGYITISRKSYSSYRPGNFNTFVSKENVKGYHFNRLFEMNKAEPNYLATKEEIKGAFLAPKLEYSQYIGIPIICSGNKMIGLIQIISCEESKLAADENGLKSLYNDYLCLYSSLILLSNKIEQINEIEKRLGD